MGILFKHRVSVWDDETVLEMNGDDNCTIFVNVINATRIVKNG